MEFTTPRIGEKRCHRSDGPQKSTARRQLNFNSVTKVGCNPYSTTVKPNFGIKAYCQNLD